MLERLKKQWDGSWACRRDWRPRQPQDFVRGVVDDQSVTLSRPLAPATFTAEAIALVVPTE